MAVASYGNLSSAGGGGAQYRSPGWMQPFDPSSSGRLAASLGTAAVQSAGGVQEEAIRSSFNQYTRAMDNLQAVADTGISGATGMAQRGLAELAGVKNAGINAGMNMAVRGQESRNALASQQATLDMQAAAAQAQKDAAAKARQGNMIGGLIGTAVDIGTAFIPGASAAKKAAELALRGGK